MYNEYDIFTIFKTENKITVILNTLLYYDKKYINVKES